MDKTAAPATRHADPSGTPGVLGLPCTACHSAIIIINANAYTGQPLYCQACQELIDHPDRPIPYHLVDRGYIQPVSA